MLQKLRKRMESEKGFTLIELLVVVLIIGILAAIALPAFLGQRQKAQDGEAKSAARTAATAAEAYYTDGQTYVGMDKAALQTIEPTLKDGAGASLAVSGVTATAYTVAVDSKSTVKYSLAKDQTSGITTRTCAPVSKGACPSTGKW